MTSWGHVSWWEPEGRVDLPLGGQKEIRRQSFRPLVTGAAGPRADTGGRLRSRGEKVGPALGSLETIPERFWLVLSHHSAQGRTPEAGVGSDSGSVAPAVGRGGE